MLLRKNVIIFVTAFLSLKSALYFKPVRLFIIQKIRIQPSTSRLFSYSYCTFHEVCYNTNDYNNSKMKVTEKILVNLKSIKKSIKTRNKQISKAFAQVETTLADHIHSDVKLYFDKADNYRIHLDEKTPEGQVRHVESAEGDHSFKNLMDTYLQKPQTDTLNQLTNSIYNLWSESFKNTAVKVSAETEKASELAQDILADVVKQPANPEVAPEQAEALNQALKGKANYSAEWSDVDHAIEVFYNPPKKDRQLLATIANDQTVTYTDALNTKRVMKKELPDMIAAVLA